MSRSVTLPLRGDSRPGRHAAKRPPPTERVTGQPPSLVQLVAQAVEEGGAEEGAGGQVDWGSPLRLRLELMLQYPRWDQVVVRGLGGG